MTCAAAEHVSVVDMDGEANGREMNQLQRWIWVQAYSLEERRELHAKNRRYARSAACCVGLCVLSLFRV